MCLCQQMRDRINLVCLDCKTSTKDYREKVGEQKNKCPQCQKSMIDIGSKIEIPKKTDKKAWKKLSEIVSKTDYFSVCQCGCKTY